VGGPSISCWGFTELATLTYLSPSPIAFLDDFSDGPSFRRSFAREHVLDHHGGRESGGDVEYFEVAGASVSELHDSERYSSECYSSECTSKSRKGSKSTGRVGKTYKLFPLCLSSQTLLDLLKMCSLVCSAGNM
jgi:hypothetical protein